MSWLKSLLGIAPREQKVIAVLGMHRSGTSCLTGLLEESGVFLGDVSKKNPYNKKGNQENSKIMALNDAVLAGNGGAWNEPPEKIVWTKSQKHSLQEILKDYSKHTIWGFKDPRCVLTLEGWKYALPNLNYIGTFRHPISVAKSLESRQAMPIEDGLKIWLEYNKKLLLWQQDLQFSLVNFDLPQEQYLQQVRTAFLKMGLDVPSQNPQFFEQDLRTQQADINHKLESDIDQVYQQLLLGQCQ